MTYEDILYEVDGPVLTVTLNRPDKLNAFTNLMGRELADALQRADRDDDIRVVILTGAGRGFCAGADISAGAGSFDTKSGEGAKNFGDGQDRGEGSSFVHALFNSKKPTIAAFNGPAVGVGATMALPTDIKIASDTARFGFVFARRGLVPEAASAWFLPQLVGMAQALRWAISGNVFDAQEALQGGLVSEVVPAEMLLNRAREIAMDIADNTAPVSVALTRQLIWRFGSDGGPFDLMKIDGAYALERGSTDDVKEGVASFLEKRKPDFPGKVSTDMPPNYPWWTSE
ncbi:enoyl-CoA hydratase [Pacificimonas flava]|uniref:Enoyl-CoA hydratase n=2 Tax=Pacificimonas TaxID=1960290 RepID=A0A219B3U0_9SPHN|nr:MULTISPECIES: enoyl-CoA hydratase-related protein [Pacificimonas]MBZ6377858.1 enoyl-CoA hydratase/isomerase family protein [Pacificimonas aurantium]OWV32479.1 enoyl-CoA hydratase [Pacificimonas flava]